MTFLYYDKQDFYRGMLDLQEKLRKSEEERIRLEERFKLLVQDSRNRHDACINKLRLRYIEFLEEERDREYRNNKLQGSLDKVDNHLALMTVKSNRLNALRKYYEAYLLQTYGNQRSSGSLTADSGVTSQHDDRSFRKDFLPQNRRHSIQSVSIPSTTPTTNFPSRILTPTLPKYSDPRFVDLPKTQQANLFFYNQQPFYSNSTIAHKPSPVFSHLTTPIPEIRISPSSSPTFVSRDVQTDKPINLLLDQPFFSVEPCQMSGIGRIPQVSSCQTLPQFRNQFSRRVTPSPQTENISQYNFTPSLPKTDDYTLRNSPRSQMDFPDFSLYKSRYDAFGNTSLSSTYPDYSWRTIRSPRYERGDFERNSTFDKSPIFKKSYIIDKTPIYNKYSTFERNSRPEDKTPHRYFKRFDFNTTFKRNDRPLPSSRDILSSSRTKSCLKPFKPLISFRNDDVYERSRRMNSEIDRYIGKIRNLYKDLDIQSFEDLDHEQNTSGDLLNVTLSDDDLDIPVEDKIKEERKVGVTKNENKPQGFGKQLESCRVSNVANPLIHTDASVSNEKYPISSNKENVPPVVIETDEINSKEETEIAENESETGASLGVNRQVVEKENEQKESDEKEIEKLHDEKEIIAKGEKEEVKVEDESLNEGPENKMEQDSEKKNKQEVELKENQIQDQDKNYQNNSNLDYNYDPNAAYEQYPTYSAEMYEQYNQEYDPSQDPSQYTNPNQYSQDPHQYNQDPNQQYEQDSNVQYQQDPNLQYEQDPNIQCEQDPNIKYEQDPSQQHKQDPNKQFEQESNQQYEQVSNKQYEQVPNQQTNQKLEQDPNQQESTQEYTQNQYDPNQQYQDPNVPYDPNQQYQDPNVQYDPNQQYQDPNAQYDPNQQYQDPNIQYDPNQQYQDPNIQYDPNQQYQDPNAQYDPNQQYQDPNIQYDPNQQYQDPNAQYDPNQQYQDPNIQYDPNQPYDPNQAYPYNAESHEYSQQDPTYDQHDQSYAQDQSYSQQDQSYDQQDPKYTQQDQPENYPSETAKEQSSPKTKTQEKKADKTETNVKKKGANNLESDTESTIERNASNTESDFDFN